MILGEDFKLRDDMYNPKEKDAILPIELLTPPYNGVIIKYKTISIHEETDQARIRFAFDVVNPGETYTITQLHKDKVFNTTLGLILNAMLLEVLEADEARNNNTEKPDKE